MPARRHDLINANDAALWIWRAHHILVKPATIRQWAARKHITSHGFRRERYDLREIVAYATERGIIPERNSSRERRQHGPEAGDSADR